MLQVDTDMSGDRASAGALFFYGIMGARISVRGEGLC